MIRKKKRRGGKIDGKRANMHLGRKPRDSGGANLNDPVDGRIAQRVRAGTSQQMEDMAVEKLRSLNKADGETSYRRGGRTK